MNKAILYQGAPIRFHSRLQETARTSFQIREVYCKAKVKKVQESLLLTTAQLPSLLSRTQMSSIDSCRPQSLDLERIIWVNSILQTFLQKLLNKPWWLETFKKHRKDVSNLQQQITEGCNHLMQLCMDQSHQGSNLLRLVSHLQLEKSSLWRIVVDPNSRATTSLYLRSNP